MNKKIKLILSGIFALVLAYYGYKITIALIYKHSVEFHNYKKYLWLFNNSIKSEIDTIFCVSHTREDDIYYKYNYKDFFISIWEIKDLDFVELKKINFSKNINLDNIEFSSGEILNKNLGTLPAITVQFKLPFNNFLNVNLNERTKIIKEIDSANYRGFFGNINKMSFTNKEFDNLILFDYGENMQQTLLLFYKKNYKFYLILVNSDKEFDESVINIFDLK